MAIWDFGTFETDDLERILEMKDELDEMGLDLFDEDMLMEVRAELSNRSNDEMDTMIDEDDETPQEKLDRLNEADPSLL